MLTDLAVTQPGRSDAETTPEQIAIGYRQWLDRPHKPVSRLLNKIYSVWAGLVYPFAALGPKTSIHYTCDIRNPFLIELGNYILIDKDVWLHPVVPNEPKNGPAIVIEDNCLIARRVQIAARNRIHVGKNVFLSANVLLTDNSHEYENVAHDIGDQGFMKGGTVHIEDGCWIGHGAAIVCTQGDLTLGRNCVVAANALVTKSFPAYSVVAGNPARLVKQFDSQKGQWVLGGVAPRKCVTE